MKRLQVCDAADTLTLILSYYTIKDTGGNGLNLHLATHPPPLHPLLGAPTGGLTPHDRQTLNPSSAMCYQHVPHNRKQLNVGSDAGLCKD